MDKNNMKIGIALSGGGIRATIFHLGIFKYLAEKGLIKHVTTLSTPTSENYRLILRHGYESAKCTYTRYVTSCEPDVLSWKL